MPTVLKQKLELRNQRDLLSVEREGKTGFLLVADGENERSSEGYNESDAVIKLCFGLDDIKILALFLNESISQIEAEARVEAKKT